MKTPGIPSVLPSLYVWGRNQLFNQLLASEIKRIAKKTVHVINHVTLPCVEFLRQDDQHLLFCDCWQEDVSKICHSFDSAARKMEDELRFVLVNVTDDALLVKIIGNFNIDGIFYTGDSLPKILKGIHTILSGELWLSRDLMTQSLQSVRQGKTFVEEPINLLTAREREILQNIAAGYSNQEIAERLYISTNTVKTHVSNIYAKIEAPNRVQAILWASKYLNNDI